MADAMTGTKGIYEKARRDQNGAIIVQTMNQSEPIIWAILRAQNYVKKWIILLVMTFSGAKNENENHAVTDTCRGWTTSRSNTFSTNFEIQSEKQNSGKICVFSHLICSWN